METKQAKQLAHELSIEYIRIKTGCFSDVIENIPKLVDNFADINQKFYNAIVENETLNKLY